MDMLIQAKVFLALRLENPTSTATEMMATGSGFQPTVIMNLGYEIKLQL